MSHIATITFTGKSGRKYTFSTYLKDTNFRDIGAVYIFTRRYQNPSGAYSQTPLYIGESGELGTRIKHHEKWPCVTRQGCTHISVMAVSNDRERLDIETDLIQGYQPVCNKQ